MRKIFFSALAIVSLLALQGTGIAQAKSSQGAQKIAWNLSGSVMPVPPYGSLDSAVTDAVHESKLIVVQPKGKVALGLTASMEGLQPNTTYTAYVSKGYTPFTSSVDVSGTWAIAFEYNGGTYTHDMVLTQTGDNLIGAGGYPSGGPYVYEWAINSGTVTGNVIDFTADYITGADALSPLTTMHVTGTIAADGTMSGVWSDNYQGGSRSGTWTTTSGHATITNTGSSGWPGLYSSSIQPITFTTDSEGEGSFHINVRSDALASGSSTMSVWINTSGRTVLISDPFTVK